MHGTKSKPEREHFRENLAKGLSTRKQKEVEEAKAAEAEAEGEEAEAPAEAAVPAAEESGVVQTRIRRASAVPKEGGGAASVLREGGGAASVLRV